MFLLKIFFHFIHFSFSYFFSNHRHVLHFAAAGGNLSIFQSLSQGVHTVKYLDKEQNTPLHYAAKYGRVAIVKYICALGCTITHYNYYGWTAGHYAASIGNVPILTVLHENGDELNMRNSSAVPFLFFLPKFSFFFPKFFSEILIGFHFIMHLNMDTEMPLII